MKLDDLPTHLRMAFVAITQSALRFIENKMTLEQFLKFAKEMWESVEINGTEETKAYMQHARFTDIHEFGKEPD